MYSRNLKENLLLARLRITRSPDVFGQLYDLTVDRIYRFVFFKVSSEQIAEDITADVYLRAWKYIVENSVDNFNALLYQIARNLVIDHYRKQGREVPLEQPDDSEEIGPAYRQGRNQKLETEKLETIEDERIDIQLDTGRLQKHLSKLDDHHREIIVLRFIEELSIAEVADILEVTKGNARVRIHRAIQELKKIVKSNSVT